MSHDFIQIVQKDTLGLLTSKLFLGDKEYQNVVFLSNGGLGRWCAFP
jgi:hypothetical protein